MRNIWKAKSTKKPFNKEKRDLEALRLDSLKEPKNLKSSTLIKYYKTWSKGRQIGLTKKLSKL